MKSDFCQLQVSVQYAMEVSELSRQQIRAWLAKALPLVPKPKEVQSVYLTIRIVDVQEGQLLNASFRSKDYPTNVLTFEYGVDVQGQLASDIVLCWPVVQKEAEEQHKLLRSHAAHLLVHGLLHAFGYDHIEDQEAQEMEYLEVLILSQLGFSNPYKEIEVNGQYGI